MALNGSVLVTGDAGAIGSATVAVFIESGWAVLGLDMAEPTGGPSSEDHLRATADVTQPEQVTVALKTLAEMPPLRHVVAIAGGALPDEPKTQDDPEALELDVFRASVERNLTSQFVTLKAALPWLGDQPGTDRSISLTSSFNALTAQGMPAYSAAKAGLVGMMHGLVGPLGSRGIRINTVAPGTIRTPRTEAIWSHVHDHFERLERSAPLGRLGSAEDVARVYRVLALELSHVTGQLIVVDGGQTARASFS